MTARQSVTPPKTWIVASGGADLECTDRSERIDDASWQEPFSDHGRNSGATEL